MRSAPVRLTQDERPQQVRRLLAEGAFDLVELHKARLDHVACGLVQS